MIIQLNKHGPRCDLMLGDINNRGSTPSYPVLSPHIMVIKPPGCKGRHDNYASSGSDNHLVFATLKTGPPPDIAFGHADESQPVMPLIVNPPETPLTIVFDCIAGGMSIGKLLNRNTRLKAKG